MNAKLNRRERKAAQLLAHYATCERIAAYLGKPDSDGKKISGALFKIEREANSAATAQCNAEAYNGQPYREETATPAGEESENTPWTDYLASVRDRVARVFGRSHMHPVPGFFVNTDPRGYALKIDNDTPEGKALIEAVKLHTDWGGYGILSPAIDGD